MYYYLHHQKLMKRRAAEHAHAADRFAREILAILERDTTRSRRLMRNPFGAQPDTSSLSLSKSL